jgi:hypothetical protein
VILALKLIVTPLLIGAATLAGRRWGPAASGWLVGLPLTSGPVVFFVALSHGTAFASLVAAGILAGTASQAAFALAYAWVALRQPWPVAMLAGSVGFAAITLGWLPLRLPVVAVAAIVVASLMAGIALLPARNRRGPVERAAPIPRWDLPARMIVGTVLVVLLTELASLLGPRLTGLITPYPLYAAVLTVFAHRGLGPAAAIDVLRGLLFGLFAFAAFFIVLAVLLSPLGVAAAFLIALGLTLLIQGGTLVLVRNPPPSPSPTRGEGHGVHGRGNKIR